MSNTIIASNDITRVRDVEVRADDAKPRDAAKNIPTLQLKAVLIRMTPAGARESNVLDVATTKEAPTTGQSKRHCGRWQA